MLAERNIDVSAPTVLNRVQTFGPRLAAASRRRRRRVERHWTVDEVFCFRGKRKLYLYHAVDAQGQVIDALLRDKRNRGSAEAFFRQAQVRTEATPQVVITDYHRPPSIRRPSNGIPPSF